MSARREETRKYDLPDARIVIGFYLGVGYNSFSSAATLAGEENN
jgi:hypothetical protein